MRERTPVAEPSKPSRSALGRAVLFVMVLQALIFFAFGAWLATYVRTAITGFNQWGMIATQDELPYLPFGLVFLAIGIALFVVGLGTSRGLRAPSMIVLLLEASYLTTMGAGTASWRGYAYVLNYPFWLALGCAAVAVALLAIRWLTNAERRRANGLTVGAIFAVAGLLGLAWQCWVVLPYS